MRVAEAGVEGEEYGRAALPSNYRNSFMVLPAYKVNCPVFNNDPCYSQNFWSRSIPWLSQSSYIITLTQKINFPSN